MEPAVDLQVMLDARKDGHEIRSAVSWRFDWHWSGADTPIGHAPQIRQHRTDTGDWRSQIARGEEPMEQEIHDDAPVTIPGDGGL